MTVEHVQAALDKLGFKKEGKISPAFRNKFLDDVLAGNQDIPLFKEYPAGSSAALVSLGTLDLGALADDFPQRWLGYLALCLVVDMLSASCQEQVCELGRWVVFIISNLHWLVHVTDNADSVP